VLIEYFAMDTSDQGTSTAIYAVTLNQYATKGCDQAWVGFWNLRMGLHGWRWLLAGFRL
jgi:hypothetical protein